MIKGFDPQTIDCKKERSEVERVFGTLTEPPDDIFKPFLIGGDAYGTTSYETHAELWKRILDWTWDDAIYHIDIDPKNIRFTKGFDISEEFINAR